MSERHGIEIITQDGHQYIHLSDLLEWLRSSPLGAVYADRLEEGLGKAGLLQLEDGLGKAEMLS